LTERDHGTKSLNWGCPG